jgi:tetratricopeptide (TPR) repeat protein
VSSPAKDRSSADIAGLGTRLDSWKEIAAYLGKVERTVKRWELNRGLPIHRVPGGGRAGVFAYTAELDEWLKSGIAKGLEAGLEDESKLEVVEISGTTRVEPDKPAENSSAPLQIPAARVRWAPRWRGIAVGMLAAGLLGAAIYAAVIRPTGSTILNRSRALFAATQAKPNSPAPIVVSDAEKSKAHDLYLKGRFEWNQRTPDSLNRALDDFTQAIVHDPDYAEAYAGMADTYDLLREYSTLPENAAYDRSIAAARKAVELDDSLSEAHRALAFAEWWGKWNFVDGEREFRRAIELNPKDPLAHKWFANAISMQGRYSEALAEMSEAQDLNPTSLSLIADKGLMLTGMGKRDEGIAMLKDAERSAPEFNAPHLYLMEIYFRLRDYPDYLMEGEKTAETRNDPVLNEIMTSARGGYVRDRERGLLTNLYAKQKQLYLHGEYPGLLLAGTCLRLGKKEETLQLLEEAFALHDPNVLFLGNRPEWNPLSDEPRFKALVKMTTPPSASGQPLPSAPPPPDNAPLRASSDPY